MQPHTYCHFCGTKRVSEEWPRTCGACKQTTWRNPLPVVVAIVPVGTGVLLVKRAIQPKLGQLALPGGFMEAGETWQEAMAREVREETGLDFVSDDYSFHRLASSSNKEHLLIFGVAKSYFGNGATFVRDFEPNSEVSKLLVTYEPIDLAFPIHTQFLAEYLRS